MARTNKKIKKKIQNKRTDKNLPWMKIASLVLLGLVMLGVAFMLGKESLSILSRAASPKTPPRTFNREKNTSPAKSCPDAFAARMNAEKTYDLYKLNFNGNGNDGFVTTVNRAWWMIPNPTCESAGYTDHFDTINEVGGWFWSNDYCCVRNQGKMKTINNTYVTMNLSDAMGSSYANICYKNNTFTSNCSAPTPTIDPAITRFNNIKSGSYADGTLRSDCAAGKEVGCEPPWKLPYGKNPQSVNEYCNLIRSGTVGNYNGNPLSICMTSIAPKDKSHVGKSQFGICCGRK